MKHKTRYGLIAIGLAYFIGSAYNNSLYPLSIGLAVLASTSVLLLVVPYRYHRKSEKRG